jgi:hypothetical protein
VGILRGEILIEPKAMPILEVMLPRLVQDRSPITPGKKLG